jgi:hypothetical protein
MAEKMFHDLRDFSRFGFGFGRVHDPNYTQNEKSREEKVSEEALTNTTIAAEKSVLLRFA